MSNVKDLIRLNKKILGITNDERELKANEMELASKSSQRLNEAKIRKTNAEFENEKNTILNKCEKEELNCKLTNLKCNNMMSISKNKSKEKIIKKDTSTWKKTIICLFLGTISSCLSVGGLILAADKTQMISIFIFSLIFTVAILLNNTVIQSNLFDMFRLEQNAKNKVIMFTYCGAIAFLFIISFMTNNVSLNYLLNAFSFSNTCKTIMSIGFSALFDIVPFLINSTKLEYQMGQYDKSFLELFNDENNNENINQNNNQNNDENTHVLKSSQSVENREIDTIQETSKNDEKIHENNEQKIHENTRKNTRANTRIKRTGNSKITREKLEQMINENFVDGQIIKPAMVGMTGNSNFRNWLSKMDCVAKNEKGEYVKKTTSKNVVALTKE